MAAGSLPLFLSSGNLKSFLGAERTIFQPYDNERTEYHESQVSLQCGKHALNNLFQNLYRFYKDPNYLYYFVVNDKDKKPGFTNFNLKENCKRFQTQVRNLLGGVSTVRCEDTGNYESVYLEWVLKVLNITTTALSPLLDQSLRFDSFTHNASRHRGILINITGHWICAYKYEKAGEQMIWWTHDSFDRPNVHPSFPTHFDLLVYLERKPWLRCIFIA